ncbi:MAG: tRNA (N6-isopentenyl adenosine(37)-C2)-methylthiotransferase MiaB [bacterium]|nr:tRNA (N6-isopentenyl adenosine(37)-C2)-methylthiotransferase MiaB [bacterium]
MKKILIETYGCQMNKADSELVAGVMLPEGYTNTENHEEADVILLNTCAVREGAEDRILGILAHYRKYKEKKPNLVLGVIGCMAQNLKEELIHKRPWVDLVMGPDSYRDLPKAIQQLQSADHEPLVIVRRDRFENYEEIFPVRGEGFNAWVSIMRGCDNFCTFCIVPFTRGRERSRKSSNILREVRLAVEQGYQEITLLGQNVNSWKDEESGERFADLIRAVGQIEGVKRVRFTSPHPKDFPDELLYAMRENPNVLVPHIHLPLQAGNTEVLQRMNRGYSKEEYLKLVDHIREILPDVAFSTDIIVGFSGESYDQFQDTLDVVRRVRFSGAFMFKYSRRPYTKAEHMPDDVSEEEKQRRLEELIELQRSIEAEIVQEWIGKETEVMLEGVSPKREEEWIGRIPQNRPCIVPAACGQVGDLVKVRIVDARAMTLVGKPL